MNRQLLETTKMMPPTDRIHQLTARVATILPVQIRRWRCSSVSRTNVIWASRALCAPLAGRHQRIPWQKTNDTRPTPVAFRSVRSDLDEESVDQGRSAMLFGFAREDDRSGRFFALNAIVMSAVPAEHSITKKDACHPNGHCIDVRDGALLL